MEQEYGHGGGENVKSRCFELFTQVAQEPEGRRPKKHHRYSPLEVKLHKAGRWADISDKGGHTGSGYDMNNFH